MKKTKKPIIAIIISVICMAIIVILDQISKYIMVSAFGMEQYIGVLEHDDLENIVGGLQSIKVIPGILNFSFVLNDGMALGMMDDHRWVFMTLSSVAIVAILVYLFWKKPQNKLLLISLTLITGGGIGNMIDRVKLGYVIDFIDFCAFPQLWKWVFNVADSCVTVGACVLALWMILDLIKDIKAEKEKKLVESCGGIVPEEPIAEQSEVAESDEQNDGNNE